ncbi:hypothetical protein [Bacillus sp. B-jedd]|nr:hypothetical protein [Bacillus sp. B-jedd]CEG26232.1 hypothetical protein BN1002_01074 [Bacillus sp. B-jedd]
MGNFGTITSIVTGIAIIYLGFLIGKKKLLSLIIGYKESTFYGDKN